jgi:hypothetical protein
MTQLVEIHIQSFSMPRDLDAALFAQQHVACAPDLLRQHSCDLEGRVPDASSASLLSSLDADLVRSGGQIQMHDVGRFRGRLRAALAGIRETPTVVLDGQNHVGLAAARKALSDLKAAGEPSGRIP